ncbi:GNAT family N-acetyltransferase [Isoptericola croceus]|uniref:GNAT family N-acetyltransferase n=1 Tax=Isoptericola croceus TaxID=3031406 RepID=UPI0023FA47A9|nr:GNAT family N-acetyltransferase [Isoptericola croceus]
MGSRTGNEEGEPGLRQLGHGTIRVMEFRAATDDDLDLLYDLMLEAFNWDGTRRFTRSEVVADTHTARYLGGWIRPGDFGVVAVDEGRPVGAVWARALPAAAPGYGYVDDDIPEIGMAVTSEARGRGVGTALLTRCINQARTLGWKGLSLSVEDGNTAACTLYERCGFVTVGRTGNSDTMLRKF